MYKFIDVNEVGVPELSSVQTIIAGTNLDKRLIGSFRTLNVSGRGILAPAIEMTERKGGAGAWIDNIQYPARHIFIQALISEENERSLQIFLTEHVNTRTIRLQFSDEPNFYYKAVLADINRDKYAHGAHVVELDFLCADPRKFGKFYTFTTNGDVLILPNIFSNPVQTTKLTIQTAQTEMGLFVENVGSGGVLELADVELLPSQQVEFDFINLTVKRDYTSILHKLSLISMLEDYGVSAGDHIAVYPSAQKITLEVQEVLF